MTLNDFVSKYNGKYLEVAGSADAKFQCTDAANGYIRDVLDFPIIEWTNAIDFPSKAEGRYNWIKNSLTGIPKEGDLMIFNLGSYGHISIFIEGNVVSFKSLDQNFPIGTPCHVQGHNYNNVVGWMRPKLPTTTLNQAQTTIPIYLKTLLQENKLSLSNEGQIRDFFQKAIEFDGVEEDKKNIFKELGLTKMAWEDCKDQLANAEYDLQKCLSKPQTPPISGEIVIADLSTNLLFKELVRRILGK